MIDLLFAAAVTAQPATSPVPPNPCNPAESCRFVSDLVMRDRQGGSGRVRVNSWQPYLIDGKLVLFSGEVVSLRLIDGRIVVSDASTLSDADRDPLMESRMQEGQLSSSASGQEELHQAPVANNPTYNAAKDSIRIAFIQATASNMVLRLSTGYDRAVSYKAAIVGPRMTQPLATTVCPVMPGKVGLEGWGGPLFQIVLWDFTLSDPSANLTLQDCK